MAGPGAGKCSTLVPHFYPIPGSVPHAAHRRKLAVDFCYKDID